MAQTKKTVEITRGLARGEKDEKRLRAAGVTKPIYRSDKGEELGKFKMRKGEILGVVDGLLAFGEAKRDMIWAIKLLHSWGAVLLDVETGLQSDRNGVEMMSQALDPTRPSEEYKKMQAASVESRVKGRMAKAEALKIWRNPNLSTKEAISLMAKWRQATAYKQFGPRGVIPGRRPAKRETIKVIVPDDSMVPPSRRGRKGKVYFIRAGNGRVKIGFAANIESRMKSLQTGHHHRLELLHSVDGNSKTEKAFHDRFAEYRVTGEWFRIAGKLRKFLVEAKTS